MNEKRTCTLSLVFLLILSLFTQIAIGYSPSEFNSVTSEAVAREQTFSDSSKINTEIVTFDSPNINSYLDKHDQVKIDGCGTITVPGHPSLPVKTISLKFDLNDLITNVTIKVSTYELNGTYIVSPAPKASYNETGNQLTEPDSTIYNSSNLYPGKWYDYEIKEGIDPKTMSRAKFLVIHLYPVQYLPVKGKLTTAKEAQISVLYEPLFQVEKLDSLYNLLIVTSPYLEHYALILSEYKNSIGISNFVQTTDEIYSSFSGRDNPEKIRNYIKSAVENLGITTVLIFGDADQVPVRYAYIPDGEGSDGDLVETDLYYADLQYTWDTNDDGLWGDLENDQVDGIPDLYIGRLPVSLEWSAEAVINKIIEYESFNDPEDPWFNSMLLVGTDPFSAPGAEGEILTDYIADSYVWSNFTVEKLYRTYGNQTISNLQSLLNTGFGFVNYAGHGNIDLWHLGENWWIFPIQYTSNDALNLINGLKLPVVITMACLTSQFADYDCIGEYFMTNPDGGAIAYFGASRLAWAYIGESITYGLAGEMAWRFNKAFFDGNRISGAVWGQAITEYVQSHSIHNTHNGYYLDWKTVAEYGSPFMDPTLMVGGLAQLVREHDLKVSLEAPTYLPVGSSSLLNATVYNVGLDNETDVGLFLSINGTVVNSTSIPILVNGTSQTINHLWIPPTEGNYNVTAFTPPVSGEEKITNNLVSRMVYVGEKTALISYYSELTEVTYILDSMGVVYDVYDNNYFNFYTEDSDLLLDYDTVIYYNRYGLTDTEYEALKSYLSSGGNLLVTGFDSLVSDPLLAKLVCSSSTGDNMGEPDLYVVDSSHPIMDGPYGNFPEGYHITGLYSDCDAAEADASSGAVTVAELADGYDKIIAAYQPLGKVVYWNGKGQLDWVTNLDCENMFKNTLRWFETRYVHELAVDLEVPLYLLPGQSTQLNLTAYNHGLETEYDIVVQLYVNGTPAAEQVIPTLENGASTTLSYPWNPSPGWYNVTAYVEPAPDENYAINNLVSKCVDVSYSPTHVGDIIVEGDDILIIEDIYFTQKGNVYVRDNAGLIIRNATLNMDQDDYRQYEIMVFNSAWLWTEDAYIVSEYYFVTRLMEDAEGWLNSTFFGYSWDHPPVDPLEYIDVENNATLNVYGSTLGHIYCYDYSTVNVYSSDLYGLFCWDFSVVSVYDSDIEWSVYVSPWGAPDVLFQGCTLGSPRLEFSGSYFLSMESLLDPTKDALIYKNEFLEAFAGEEGVHLHTLNETTPDMMQSWLDPHWGERIIKEEDTQDGYPDGPIDASSSAVVTLTGLHPGYIGFWNIHANETVSGVDWNLTLVDTLIDGWDLSCYGDSEVSVYDSSLRYLNSYDSSTVSIYDSVIEWSVYVSPWVSSDVYFEGSTIGGLEFAFIDSSSASLTSLHPGYVGFWNIHANETVNGVDWNLTLVDTNVIDGWSLSCYDYSEVSVFDSTLNEIDSQYHSVVSIYDSTVRRIQSYDYSLVSVYNSTIYGINCFFFYGQLLLDEVNVDGWWKSHNSQFYFEGNVSFTDVLLLFWNSEVTRNYGVEVTMNDAPAPGITLTLYDEVDTPIWSGLTDASGLSNFNMTLDDVNYATVYSLRTDDYPEERDVSLISETPILIPISSNIIITSIEDVYGTPISGGVKGDTVVVKGSGVTAGAVVNLYWDYVTASGLLNSTEANLDGTFEIRFDVPEAYNGDHYLWVMDTVAVEASVWGPFTVVSTITLDVENGPVGTVVAVSGSGFKEGTVDTITLNGDFCTAIGAMNIDELGTFTGSFVIPGVEILGTYEITLTDSNGLSANNDFLITGLAEIVVSPNYGAPGATITITGSNFTQIAGTEVTVTMNSTPPLTLVVIDTDADGSFETTFVSPAVSFQTYTVTATDEYSIDAADAFKVGLIALIINPVSGEAGTQIAITGVGFAPGVYNLKFGEKLYEEYGTVNDIGAISDLFWVPNVEPGTYDLTVIDTDENELTLQFTITESTYVIVDPVVAPNNYNVSIKGYHFADIVGAVDFVIYNSTDDWKIDVWQNGAGTDPAVTDIDGNFMGWWLVLPKAEISLGDYTVNITGSKGLLVQVPFSVVEARVDVTPREAQFVRGDIVAFDIVCDFKYPEAYIEIYDPSDILYWQTDVLDIWLKVEGLYVVPYYAQTSGLEPMELAPDAPLGIWSYTFYETGTNNLTDGTFTVNPHTPPPPPMPHRFWGTVTIDGVVATDGILVEAKIDGVTYISTTTLEGQFGYTPTFIVPADDPGTVGIEGGVAGDTVEFYVGGVLAATHTDGVPVDPVVFANGGVTELDLVVGGIPSCVSIGSAIIASGYTTEVPVNMSHVTKSAGLGFDLYWDPAVISINGIRLSDYLSTTNNSLSVGIDQVLGKAVVALVNTHPPDYLTWEEERSILIVEIEATGLHGNSSLLDLMDVEVTDAETWIPSPVSNVEDGMVTIQNLGSIHGYVTYSYNGAPMEGATVKLSRYGSTLNTTVSGVSGEYEFLDLLLGEYNLTVSHERVQANSQYTTFWNASASANVTPGETAEVDFSLKIRGDLNDQGEVDIGDVAKTANMYVGNVPEEVDLTDFNGNGELDIGDVAKLANYYVENVDEV